MTRLKIHLSGGHGECDCYMEIPKGCLHTVGEERMKAALSMAYNSLGAEVCSVQRVEEVSHEI